MPLRRGIVIGGQTARAFLERFLQRGGALIFAQQVEESLVRQILHALTAVQRQKLERLPDIRGELDQLALGIGRFGGQDCSPFTRRQPI